MSVASNTSRRARHRARPARRGDVWPAACSRRPRSGTSRSCCSCPLIGIVTTALEPGVSIIGETLTSPDVQHAFCLTGIITVITSP